MQPRYGRGLTTAVLRPLAEQLIDALRVPVGGTVCELLCDSGELSRTLAPMIGFGGTFILTDTDAELLDRCAHSVRGTCTVVTDAIVSATLHVDDGVCDRVTSLLTLDVESATQLLNEARRIVASGGVVACLVWDVSAPPPYELALARALRDEVGIESPLLRRMASPTPIPEGYSASVVRDVARFDGFDHLWSAMAEHQQGVDTSELTSEALEAMRGRCAAELAAHAAADGTLRIPVTALLLSLPRP